MPLPTPSQIVTQAQTKLHTLVTLTRAGIVHPERPDRLWHTARALLRYGTTPAAGYTAAARNFPDEPAVIDELGTLTFKEVDERSNALAHAFAADGVQTGDGVAIMCRNHRGWIDAVLACSKLGANALFLNTAFSGPQLTDVAKREKPKAVVYDQEFAAVLKDAGSRRKRYVAWTEGKAKDPALEALIAAGDPSPPPAPSEQGRAIILTSGTTGTPKGASRSMPKSIDPIAALLSVIPLQRAREDDDRGAAVPRLGLRAVGAGDQPGHDRGPQAQVRRGGHAQPHGAARVHRARRGAGDDPAHPRARRRGARPLRPLAACAPCRCSGSALPGLDLGPLDGPLRREPLQPLRLDRGGLGDDRHAARPARGARDRRQAAARQRREDLRRGRPSPCRPARPGASSSATTSSSRATPAAATRTRSTACCRPGTSGTSTTAGRLFIDGRDDDMIVSGGENVFPGEVEDLLHGHDERGRRRRLRRRGREVRPAPEGRDRQEGRRCARRTSRTT